MLWDILFSDVYSIFWYMLKFLSLLTLPEIDNHVLNMLHWRLCTLLDVRSLAIQLISRSMTDSGSVLFHSMVSVSELCY